MFCHKFKSLRAIRASMFMAMLLVAIPHTAFAQFGTLSSGREFIWGQDKDAKLLGASCLHGMKMKLIFTDIGTKNPIYKVNDPQYYVNKFSTLRDYGTAGIMCKPTHVELTVFDPAGKLIVRDVLTDDRGFRWKSQIAQNAEASLATQVLTENNLSDPRSFYPENIKFVKQYFEVVNREYLAERSQCFSFSGNRVECINNAVEKVEQRYQTFFDAVKIYLTDFPNSRDGLKALNGVYGHYDDVFPVYKGSDLAPQNQKTLNKLEALIEQRRREIETPLKAGIMADYNAGQYGLIAELFPYDKKRGFEYDINSVTKDTVARIPPRKAGEKIFALREKDITSSNREADGLANFTTLGQPTDNEIGLAYMRAFRTNGGKLVNNLTVTIPNFDSAMDGLAGLIHIKIYEVRSLGCVKAGQGFNCTVKMWCDFDYTGINRDDLRGIMLMKFLNTEFERKPTVYYLEPTAAGWKMPTLEAKINQAKVTQFADMMNAAAGVAGAAQDAFGFMINSQSSSSSGNDAADELEKKRLKKQNEGN